MNHSTTLYYREGSSDKVYQAAVTEQNGGFVVNFAYGRRGTTLQTGTKTQSPVPYPQAKGIYDKLIREKTAKGYTPGTDGTPYVQTDQEARVSGISCQLLNAVDEDALDALMHNPSMWMQEKFDGKRMLVRVEKGGVTGINRKGLTVGLSATVAQSALAGGMDFIMDGEVIGDVLYAFDLLTLNGDDLRSQSYKERNLALINLLAGAQMRAIHFVESSIKSVDKERALAALRLAGKEGVVFKDCRAAYTAGRPASGGNQLKYKFTATASFLVVAVNQQRSVALGLYGTDGRIAEAGNVTIPPNRKVPPVNAVVEVRYLYAFRESGHVYQPFYLGERDDVDAIACKIEQLKFRAGDEDDAG